MSKRILIDTSNPDETRVAVTSDGKLDDFEIESGKKNAVKGDVYLAKITRVEPSLQAAFVDFGANRNGFLPLTEIHPDYFKIPVSDQKKFSELLSKINDIEDKVDESASDVDNKEDRADNIEDHNENSPKEEINYDISKKKKDPHKEYLSFFRKYKIQDVIKPRQVILVQINKEERGFKGAALTTFLSFAGRYCVLMPNSLNKDGISRKISDIEERKKLKVILSNVNVPDKMSIIVRTAGIGKNKKEISKDLSYLTNLWNKIREDTLKAEAPRLIYEEGSLIKRTIRDMLTDDVDNILIEGKAGFETAKKIIKKLVPQKIKNIKLHKDNEKSLFIENNIENQINELFSLTVKLESGGSIVINTTEALVAIDVNSGKNTSERNIENTALKTNIEAAVEIPRQLRLRDLGGLVVIDFIDMDDYRNNFKVEKTIKTALNKDRARVQIGRISMFGLLELSRQRLRSSLIDRSFEKCPFCKGSGLILNTNSIAEQIIKMIQEKVLLNKGSTINVKCNSSLAEILINTKKEEIYQLESQNNSKVIFNFNTLYSLHEPSVEMEKKRQILEKKEVTKKKTKKEILTKKTTKKKEIKIKPRKKKKSIESKKLIDDTIIKKSEVSNIDKNKKEEDKIATRRIKKDSQKDEKEATTGKVKKDSQKDEVKSGWWTE